jgi:hypothetical protein
VHIRKFAAVIGSSCAIVVMAVGTTTAQARHKPAPPPPADAPVAEISATAPAVPAEPPAPSAAATADAAAQEAPPAAPSAAPAPEATPPAPAAAPQPAPAPQPEQAAASTESSQPEAGLPPPERPAKLGMPVSTLRKKPASALILGGYRVVLEQTSLPDILRAIGRGAIAESGSGEDYRASLCYTIPGRMPARLWLSAGTLHGGYHVDGVDITSVDPSAADSAGCPELPAGMATVQFDNGLALGSTEADLLRNLGAPGLQAPGFWSFAFTQDITNYKITTLFETQLAQGRVAWVRVRQSAVF